MATEIIPLVMIALCLSFRNFPATPPACVSGLFGIATARAAVVSLLSPAREAGGAEDRLWNSGHFDGLGRLRWSRRQCRRRSGGGLLLQRLPE
jgi:hypothetical protein